MLCGSNFAEQLEQILFALGSMDLDLALLIDGPAQVSQDGSPEDKVHCENWKRSNCLSLMYIKMTIAKNIPGSIPPSPKARDYLASVEQRFASSDKSLAGTLMAKLTTMKYDGLSGVQEHILQTTDIAAQLDYLDMKLNEPFLVQFILNSLP